MPIFSQDNVALQIISAGRDQGLDNVGIIAGISCGLVESNLTVYANEKDPPTMALPHDAVGSDSLSSGVFQQQPGKTWDAKPSWWGTVECRMDPKCSAGQFFSRFKLLPYKDGRKSVGQYVADVQQCNERYRGRYDERMDEAKQIFDRLRQEPVAPPVGATVEPVPAVPAPQFTELDYMTGGGRSSRTRPIVNWFFHTEEGNSNAEQLARYCDGSHNVSYHYTVRDGIVCDVVDTDFASWSVLDANVFSINLCFAGSRAGWSRDEWLQRERDIEIATYLAVQDCRKYSLSTEVLAPPYQKAGGISDHKYVTQCLGIGTHTDCGDNFPWDRVRYYRDKYIGKFEPVPTPPEEGPPPFVYPPPDEMIRQIWEQMFGPEAKGWEFFGKTADDSRSKYAIEVLDEIQDRGDT